MQEDAADVAASQTEGGVDASGQPAPVSPPRPRGEQRAGLRIATASLSTIELGGSRHDAVIVNVSEKGAQVLLPLAPALPPLASREPIRLHLRDRDGDVLKVRCRERWFKGPEPGSSAHFFGLEVLEPTEGYLRLYRSTYFDQRTRITRAPIAVIGMACHYPGARDTRRFWENILARRREFRRIPERRLSLADYYDPDPAAPDKTYADQAAVIEGFVFDWVRRGIPRSVVESTDISHWLALEVALRALEDAGYRPDRVPSDRSGVIVGNTLTGEHSRAEGLRLRWPFVRKVLRSAAARAGLAGAAVAAVVDTMEAHYKSVFAPVTEDTLAGNLSNTIAGRICNFLNLNGGGYTVDGACSSSLMAVSTAATALTNGNLDLAIAGGVDVSLDTFELIGFAKTRALTRDQMRVYDRRASGFIPGEGAGFVVLKRLADARAAGDRVYAVLRGWGTSSDGRGGITAPKAETQALAVRRAYTGVDYAPGDVDFFEGHGTGTPAGDRAELTGLALAIDGGRKAPYRRSGVTSVKSIIGHTKAASGIAGFIKAAMALNRRVLPPTANCLEPSPVFEESAPMLFPILQGEIRPPGEKLRAGVSAMGFGGINCHVTLESGDEPSPGLAPALEERRLLATTQETELFVLGAPSPEALLDRVRELMRSARGLSEGDLADLARDAGRRVEPSAPRRCAVIADAPETLQRKLQELESLLVERPPSAGQVIAGAGGDVLVGNGLRSCRVGFLFPGQGSQRTEMARILVERHGWARELVEDADRCLGELPIGGIARHVFRSHGALAGREEAEDRDELLRRSEYAQPAICLASVLWDRRLRLLGIEPAAVGGHSLGELTALHAAGAFDAMGLLRLAALRGEAMAAPGGEAGAMAALGCPPEAAAGILDGIEGHVVIANLNAPRQVVVSGEAGAVAAAAERARRQGIASRMLPVSNAFHSRFVEAAAGRLRLEAPVPDRLGPLRARLFTGMGGRPLEEGERLRDHLADQVVSQVDFVSLVRALAGVCDLLVEVGPGRVLAGLARSTLGPRGPACLPVESRPGRDRDLHAVLAEYFVRGGDVRWEALYEDRLTRDFVPVSERVYIESPCERPLEVPAGALVPAAAGDDPLEAIVTDLPQAEGLSPSAWSAYLARRGDFLREVVQADMRHFAFSEPAADEPRSEPDLPDPGESQAGPQAVGRPQSGAEIEELLLALVTSRTGFPSETLSPEMRLLDDLNLDSIKAGAIIADAASQVGVAGRVDPVDLVNASLRDLARRLESTLLRPGEPETDTTPASPTSRNRWIRDYVMVGVEEPLVISTPEVTWRRERVLLLHDRGEKEVAAALQARLERRGAEVVPVPFGEAGRLRPGDLEGATCYLTLLPRRQGPEAPLTERLPAMIARLQCLAGLPLVPGTSPGRVTAAFVQFGGGDFGFGGEAGLEQCAARALAAGFHLERPDIRVRVIDLSPRLDLSRSGDLVAREIEAPGTWEAAGYDDDAVRRVLRARLVNRAACAPRPVSWSGEDVVLVTGGGKGISAECALAFAGATGVRMALVGSSPHPEGGDGRSATAVARTLERFSKAGLDCRYFACDISDERATAALVVRISAEMGRITGVIHGAARNVPRAFSRVSREEALEEVAPKVLGAWNLASILGGTGLKLFAGISSVIGVTGMGRNAWYGFSNEVLDLILSGFARSHPETAVVSMAFSVWGEVGMGVRLGSLSHLRRMGVGLIGARDGVESFLRLMREDAGSTRVVVASLLGGLDTWRLERPLRPVARRFLEEILLDDPGRELVARAHLSVQRDRYLGDHVWRDSALFPTVFGLEAMAQAAAQLKGLRELPPLRIEDIRLERPIVVPADTGLTIQVQASSDEGNPDRIRAAVLADQTGYAREHFAATFRFDSDVNAPDEPPELPARPLPIDPERDLYGGLLFQGPLFRRIEAVHALAERRALLECGRGGSTPARQPEPEAGSPDEPFILGDPYFRDALLQSCQLVAAQDECLPVGIESIDIVAPNAPGGARRLVATTLDQTDHQSHVCSVTTVDPSGRVIERIRGCTMRILRRHEDRPTATELASPGDRDSRLLREELRSVGERLQVAPPALEVRFEPGLHRLPRPDRHAVELPAMQRAVRAVIGGECEFEIDWDESGRPVVRVPEGPATGVSVSHDERYLLAVAGVGPQGCDVEPIAEPGQGRWQALLGSDRAGLLEELVGQGDERQVAGTRLWCVEEAWRKASGSAPSRLGVVDRDSDAVVLGGDDPDGLEVLTFPLRLTFGPPRMVACVVRRTRQSRHLADRPPIAHGKTLADLGYDGGRYGLGIGTGPQGQVVYVQRFPVTFRDFQNRSRSVYFTSYFRWMGSVREYSLAPVMDRLYRLCATGEWGMATNSSETRILGDLAGDDIVEARLWMEREVGDLGATFDWMIEWHRALPEGGSERVAFSRLRATWIQVVRHGVAQPRRMPAFLEEFIGLMRPPGGFGAEGSSPPHPEADRGGHALGPLVARTAAGPGLGPALLEETFRTSLEDSNLVGNVYFANYATWQGRVRDRYFHRLAPRFYRGHGEEGELRCRWVKVDHVREAMPFDHVEVVMHLQAVFEQGVELKFEFHRVTPGEERIKLASSTHEAVWVVPGPAGRPAAAAWPAEFRKALLEQAGRAG